MNRILFFVTFVSALCFFACTEDKPQVPANKLPKDTTEDDLRRLNQDFVKIEEEMIEHYIDSLDLKLQKGKYGFKYQMVRDGYGDSVAHDDEVTVRYSIVMLDGQPCDKLQVVVKTFPAGNGKVIKGIDEIVKLMRVGGEADCIFPSYLAYGVAGKGECVAPWSPVRCKIELIDCKKKSNL